MNKFKKISAFILSFVMLLSLGLPANADTSTKVASSSATWHFILLT